jgi:hypothetical protein
MKPTKELIEQWANQAHEEVTNADVSRAGGSTRIAVNIRVAQLAAQWGAEQALRINTRDDNPTAIHDKARPRCICCGGVVMQEQGGGVCIPCAIEEGIKP